MNLKNNRYSLLNEFFDNSQLNKNPKSAKDIQSNLEILEQRLDKTSREIEYYDLMNVQGTISNQAEYDSKKLSLGVNESLVIKGSKIYDENQHLFNLGDFILKDMHGRLIRVANATSAIFYPSKYDTTDHILYYSYSTESPSDGESFISITDNSIDKPTRTIKIPEVEVQEPNGLFNEWLRLVPLQTEYTVKAKTNQHRPIIKFFCSVQNNEEYEEIFLDYSMEFQENKGWKIIVSNFPNLTNIEIVMVVK